MINDEDYRHWYALDQCAPVLGFGAWQIAGNHAVAGKPNGWGNISEADAVTLVHCALEKGIQFFDTAQAYGDGASEKILGKAFHGHQPAQHAIVCTKVVPDYHSAQELTRRVERSLRNLKRECVDILLLHNPADDFDFTGSSREAFERLREQGKIRDFGISGRTMDSIHSAITHNFGQTMEWNCNLLERRPVTDLLPACAEKRVNFIARSPLARGLLSSTFYHSGRTRFDESEFRSTLDPEWVSWVRLQLEIIQQRDPEADISVLALQYLRYFGEITAMIPGMKTMHQLDSAVGMLSLPQPVAEFVHDIDEALPVCYPKYA